MRVFLFNGATGDPAFAETGDVITPGSGWHLVIVQFDGTASTEAEKLKVFVDGQQHALELWGDALPTQLAGATGAPFEVGDTALELGELAIFDGLTSALERAAWQSIGIDFDRSDLLAGYRWEGDLTDVTGANDLTGHQIQASDFGTTPEYPVR